MKDDKRQALLAKIKASIDARGYHVRIVDGGPLPRFCYTIGLHPKVGFEIIFAGGLFFTFDEALEVMNQAASGVLAGGRPEKGCLEVVGVGGFMLAEADGSWVSRMLLGATDYFGGGQLKAFQVVPDRGHRTVDVPDLRATWNAANQPMWQWFDIEWPYAVSSKSKVATNLDALRGRPITEAMRWEESEWEMFSGAGPDVDPGDIRQIPLGVLLALDPTLKPVVDLKPGYGLWRDDQGGEWHAWGKGEDAG